MLVVLFLCNSNFGNLQVQTRFGSYQTHQEDFCHLLPIPSPLPRRRKFSRRAFSRAPEQRRVNASAQPGPRQAFSEAPSPPKPEPFPVSLVCDTLRAQSVASRAQPVPTRAQHATPRPLRPPLRAVRSQARPRGPRLARLIAVDHGPTLPARLSQASGSGARDRAVAGGLQAARGILGVVVRARSPEGGGAQGVALPSVPRGEPVGGSPRC